MKSVLIAGLAVLAVGCSSTPSNKELAIQNEEQSAFIEQNTQDIKQNEAAVDEKIDRAFKKSQMK